MCIKLEKLAAAWSWRKSLLSSLSTIIATWQQHSVALLKKKKKKSWGPSPFKVAATSPRHLEVPLNNPSFSHSTYFTSPWQKDALCHSASPQDQPVNKFKWNLNLLQLFHTVWKAMEYPFGWKPGLMGVKIMLQPLPKPCCIENRNLVRHSEKKSSWIKMW